MKRHLSSLCIVLCFLNTIVSGLPCFDSTTVHYENEVWIYRENLKVICQKGEIFPLGCVTALGTTIPLGTSEFQESDVIYSCLLDEGTKDADVEGSGSGEGDALARGQPECSINTVGLDWSDGNSFAYHCAAGGITQIVGCVAPNGQIVPDRHAFVAEKGMLRICRIAKNGAEARVEYKGCFTGSGNPEDADLNDPMSLNFKKKYSAWRVGDVEYRCGDEGIFIYRCFVEIKGKPRDIYYDSVWVDSAGVAHYCG